MTSKKDGILRCLSTFHLCTGCLALVLKQRSPLARNSESHRFLESGVGRGFDPALLIQKTHFYLQIKYFYL